MSDHRPPAFRLPPSAFLLLYWLAFQYVSVPDLAIFGGRRIEFLRTLLTVVWSDYFPKLWFGSPPQVSLLNRLGLLALAAFIFVWAAAAGWLVLRPWRRPAFWTRLETLLFSTVVGLNLISTGVLLLGLIGQLRCRILLIVAALGTLALAGKHWRSQWHATRSESHPTSPSPDQSGLSRQWLWWLVPLALIILLGGLLPPTDFDVREYHLQAPKEFYQNGRIEFLPHNVYANMPLGSEMFALLAMILLDDPWHGALVGKAVIAAFALLGAAGLYAAGRRFFSPAAGLAAALIYLSLPWTLFESLHGLIDGVVGVYLFLAIYALLLTTPLSRSGRGVGGEGLSTSLSGYLLGAAVACKYPALLFGVVPLLAWMVVANRWAGWRETARRLLIFLLALTAGCGLWLAKNACFTGNPTYPLLYCVFGGQGWSPAQDAQWNAVHQPRDFSAPRLFHDLGRVALTSPWLSPLVMPLALLALLTAQQRRLALTLALLFAYALAAWWLLTHRIDRFWIPLLPLPCLLAGAGMFCTAKRSWQWLAHTLLVITLGNAVLAGVSETFGSGHLLVDLQRLRADPERIGVWRAYFNEQVKHGRLLLIGEAQVFDYEVPIVYSTCFNENLLETLARGKSSGELHAALREQQIAYLYVNWSEIARYRQPGNYGFSDFFTLAFFEGLVSDGVLAPLPDLPDSAGRGYRVKARSTSHGIVPPNRGGNGRHPVL